MSHEIKEPRPDAFKELMAAARVSGRPELAHQGRGRPLTQAEDDFAEALMAIYGDGVQGAPDLAKALAMRNVTRPSSGKADWTADTLEEELKAINADLDQAYAENGFGA
ncbi:recombinase-like helix-turn-helix domain-containing protein [Hasllibacter sp. MH4015]|uniref:recombinase-like helix-turn-helix domain-containing protein n=1 Tax=Hasllibacter sp. MH4015 TaxID=2854029 RepID=UPI001CD49718|nr:recombinase-like helix-turn-helix domain-containing protein [Hasllibacter sp. MH4015]